MRVGIVLVLVFIVSLAQTLLQLSVFFALEVRLHLGFEGSALLLPFFLDAMRKADIADGSRDDSPVLLQSPVRECHQVLKGLQSELAHHVLVVVEVILDHVLGVELHVLELLKRLSVVAVQVVGPPGHLLEPHCLVVVYAHVIAAVLHEEVHDSRALLHAAVLQLEHGTDRVDGSVCGVEIASFFVQLCRLRPVASLLANLAFESVQLEESGRVLDRHVDEVHRLS